MINLNGCVAYFTVLSQYICPEGDRKMTKNGCQDSKFLGKVLKLLPPKYKTELWFMKKISNI
jgi:hypothetical protein